ncbi:hypothetical protein BGZ98_009093 [Dissophora globulifera]|nr:hypothetical protein BGZ98_009093 [Dissophora globulifera]
MSDKDSQQQQEQQPLDSQRPRTSSSIFRRASFHIHCFTSAVISNSPFSQQQRGQRRQRQQQQTTESITTTNYSAPSKSGQQRRAPQNLLKLDTDGGKERYRIAIIADPQLTDWYSYNQTGLLLKLVETYTDIYMKRSFHRLHTSLRPDAVLFLGDLNDGGRDSEQEIFDKNERRFYEHVFETGISAWNQRPVVTDDTTQGESWSHGQSEDNINITGHYHQRVDIPLDAN